MKRKLTFRALGFMISVVMLFSMFGCGILSDKSASSSQLDGTSDTTTAGGADDLTSAGEATPAPDAAQEGGKLVEAILYFATPDNEAVKKEIRQIPVKDGAIIAACIKALVAGPTTEGLQQTIPEGTRLLGANRKGALAIVDLSSDYLKAQGVAEIVARASIVNTLTELNGIERVLIRVEGEDLIGPSGEPFGEMSRFALDEDGKPVAGEMRTLTLYFGNDNADKVVAEKRQVPVVKGQSDEKAVILELIKGPTKEGLHPVIPEGTRLLSIKTVNGLCTVNFSKEFIDNHPGGTAGESMTLESIVNSLTELKHIKKVQFLIEGEKREVFLHVIFDKPFERNPGMIGEK